MQPWHTAVLGLIVAMLNAYVSLYGSAAAREGYGRNVLEFTYECDKYTNGQDIRFEHTGYTPLQALLGYNQPESECTSTLDPIWIIRPLDEAGAVLVSDPIWQGGTQTEIRVALYTIGNRTKTRGQQ